MKELLNNKWMVVGAVWCCVLLFSIFNFYEIKIIKENKLEHETLKMDQQFIKLNSEKIKHLMQEESLLYHKIASVGIGILVVENQLRQLAQTHNFSDIRLEPGTEADNDTQIPLKLFASGAIPDMVSLLNQINSHVPYLSVNQIEWTNDLYSSKVQFNLLLNYRYVLKDTGREA